MDFELDPNHTRLPINCYSHSAPIVLVSPSLFFLSFSLQRGGTALFSASMNGHADTVEVLLKHGANVEARSNKVRSKEWEEWTLRWIQTTLVGSLLIVTHITSPSCWFHPPPFLFILFTAGWFHRSNGCERFWPCRSRRGVAEARGKQVTETEVRWQNRAGSRSVETLRQPAPLGPPRLSTTTTTRFSPPLISTKRSGNETI